MAKLLVQKEIKNRSYRTIATHQLKDSIRSEKDLVKFLKDNHGTGRFSVLFVKKGLKGFRLLWKGTIKERLFRRVKGELGRYIPGMKLSKTKVWHRIDSKSN